MSQNIAIVGLWHQGIVAAACLADAGFNVVATDARQETIDSLEQGRSPIFEPGLDELLKRGIEANRLSFSSDLTVAAYHASIILLMQDTPVDENDIVDPSSFWTDVETILPHLKPDTVLYVTAQVPVGSCASLIEKTQSLDGIGVAYSPENLRLGQAIDLFRNPALPVIGVSDDTTLARLKPLLDVFDAEFKVVALASAEMTKHALNTFLALSVSYGNELGLLCDEVGADAIEVAQALRMEPRVGTKAMLYPGMAFSGGTLARDTQTLRSLGDQYDIDTRLLDGVWNSNQRHNDFIFRKLESSLGALKGKSVAVLGLTYKPGTSTLRRSASVDLALRLRDMGVTVRAHDPQADAKEVEATGIDRCETVEEAVSDSDAVLVLTPWPDYKDMDYPSLASSMTTPILIDAQNALNGDTIQQAGFAYYDIGRGRG